MVIMIDQIRALLGDDEEPYTFSDVQIEAIAGSQDNSVNRSVAALLERAARSEALTYKILKTDDLSIDGVSAAKLLYEMAKGYWERADQDDAATLDEGFNVVYPFKGQPKLLEYQEWDY